MSQKLLNIISDRRPPPPPPPPVPIEAPKPTIPNKTGDLGDPNSPVVTGNSDAILQGPSAVKDVDRAKTSNYPSKRPLGVLDAL